MRLSMRVAIGILAVGTAFSLSAAPQEEGKFGKFSKMWVFGKSGKKSHAAESSKGPSKDSSKPELAATPVTHKHTNGFPEADKKGAEHQPQNDTWADSVWKTTRNRDSWNKSTATR